MEDESNPLPFVGPPDWRRNARHLVTTYRRFILEIKAKRNLQLTSSGHAPSKGAARALVHYRLYIQAYLKAKRAVIAGQEKVSA